MSSETWIIADYYDRGDTNCAALSIDFWSEFIDMAPPKDRVRSTGEGDGGKKKSSESCFTPPPVKRVMVACSIRYAPDNCAKIK